MIGCLGVAYQTIRASRAESKANVAALEFIIEDVLGSNGSQTSTGYSPDPNLKLLILLKNASNEVDEKFADEPELKARMKSTLANLFNSVGKYDDARRLYNDYLAYLEANNGPNDPDTIEVMRELVRLNIEESRFGDAEELGTKALQNSRTYLGTEHSITLLLLSDLAMLHHKMGDTSRAVEAYEQVIETRQRTLGESHPTTLTTVSDLATVLDSEGRYEESQ
ncbi:MAG: tetratricopeptide repeat protein, partial [Rubripirellula sp.]